MSWFSSFWFWSPFPWASGLSPGEAEQVVQRLGKFHRTLGPGLDAIFPYIDRVASKVTTKDIVLDIPSQEVIAKDNAVIIANAVAYINIVSPEKSVYGVEDYRLAIQNLVQTSLRSIVGEMDLDDALSSRDQIKAKLKAAISDDIADWGITIKTVEIQDINPSETMQKAMEEQAAAERGRRATVTRADGEKAAAILEAEGRLEASKRDARQRWFWRRQASGPFRKLPTPLKTMNCRSCFCLAKSILKHSNIYRPRRTQRSLFCPETSRPR